MFQNEFSLNFELCSFSRSNLTYIENITCMKIKDISISLQKLSNKIIEIVRTSTYITSFLIVLFCISVLRIFVDATFNSLLVLLFGII